MTIEFLFPEFCNLYGDQANIRYLKACAPDIEILYTDNRSVPKFADTAVDMIYMGSMPEDKQILAIQRLEPYKPRLKDLMEQGTVFLITGNAMEILGEYIADSREKVTALGLFPFHADRNYKKRLNMICWGQFRDMKIVGYKSQFSVCRGTFPAPFIEILGGFGNDETDRNEGFTYKNLFATYLLGPILVLNPPFTKHLLRLMGHDDTLAFEQEAFEAYNFRVKQMEDPEAVFSMGEHG